MLRNEFRLFLPAALLLVASCKSGTGPGEPSPAKLALVAEPAAGAQSGVVLAPQPVIQVQDVNGEPVAARGLLVAAAIAAGAGTLGGEVALRTDENGRVTFAGLVLSGPVGTYALRFSAAGLAGVTSRQIALSAGPPGSAVVQAGNNQTAAAGTALPVAPSVRVVDGAGNPVSGASVTFAVTAGGGAVTTGQVVTGPTGIAAVGSWTLGTAVGLNTLSATVAGLAGPPLVFSATGVVGPAARLVLVEGDAQSAALGAAVTTAPAVRVSDAFDNPITGLAVTFAVASGGGSVVGAAPVSDATGVARVTQWKMGLVPGANSLTAVRAGTPTVTFTATGVDFPATSLSLGVAHACGVSGGAAWCWGENAAGQLGDGSGAPSLIPVAVAGGLTFTQVVAGQSHSCGLTTTGAAYCWGLNTGGQVGDGTAVSRSTPVAVTGGHLFSRLTAGLNHSCGIRTDGAVYCWGVGGQGRLGNGSTASNGVPQALSGGGVYTAIAAGGSHTCGVRDDGTLLCWGFNGNGRLGDGTTTDRLVPTAVSGGGVYTGVAAGGAHTCALDPAGAAWCWGSGASGQLGIGTTPAQQLIPAAVSGGLTFSLLATGSFHSCGLDAGGAAHCWGLNGSGRLGDGTQVLRSAPAPVSGGLTFTVISAGNEGTCALSAAGSALCWGRNLEGQVGDGTTVARLTPVGVKRP